MAFDWRQPSSLTGSWQALHRARGAGMSYEEWLESRMGTEGGAHEAGRKSGLCEQLGRECAAGSPQGWHDGEGTEGWPGGEWFSPAMAVRHGRAMRRRSDWRWRLRASVSASFTRPRGSGGKRNEQTCDCHRRRRNGPTFASSPAGTSKDTRKNNLVKFVACEELGCNSILRETHKALHGV